MRIESLTPRQMEVLQLVAEAKSSAEVAEALGVSIRTVEGQLLLIFQKLGVRNRTAAGKLWWEHQNGTGV